MQQGGPESSRFLYPPAPYILEDQGINSSHYIPVSFLPAAQPQALLLEPSLSFQGSNKIYFLANKMVILLDFCCFVFVFGVLLCCSELPLPAALSHPFASAALSSRVYSSCHHPGCGLFLIPNWQLVHKQVLFFVCVHPEVRILLSTATTDVWWRFQCFQPALSPSFVH